jgi:nitrogen fixation protein NifU and related proteins
MNQLYKNVIMDLYNDATYREMPAGYTTTCSYKNPLCGDLVTFYVELQNRKVKKIRFSASGCVLSQAAATFMCKILEGKDFVTTSLPDEKFMQNELGLSLGLSRLRCIMLPIECLRTECLKTECLKTVQG